MTQYERMTTAPVQGLTLRLGWPAVLGMMVTTLYNMADTWFVAQLGTQAVGAVGVAFSIMECIASLGFLLGTGSGACIGMLLGARKNDEACVCGSTAFFATLVLGLCFALPGIIFLRPLMYLLGSSDTILPFAEEYCFFILVGFPIMCLSIVLATILRYEGKSGLATMGIASGAVLNIVLDPLFIFWLDMGVGGASLATLISQVVGFIILWRYFAQGRTETKIRLASVRGSWAILRRVCVMGTPSLSRHVVTMFSNIALIISSGIWGGDVLIAAMSIVIKLIALLQSIVKGIFQGSQTIFSYNKGAGLHARVREAWWFGVWFSTVCLLIASVAAYWAAPWIVGLYRVRDPEVLTWGAFALVVRSFALLPMPWNFSVNVLLQSVGEPWKSTLLTTLPEGVLYIPALFILPEYYGPAGVVYAAIAGWVLCSFITLPFLRAYFAKTRAL